MDDIRERMCNNYCGFGVKFGAGKNIACKHCPLNELPKWIPVAEDCISRKALLEEIENGIKAGNYEEGYEKYSHINDMDDIIECIKYADSVQPKPKTDVLDKIRAEIEQLAVLKFSSGERIYKDDVLEIIDKYKAESEDKE